MLDWLNHLVQKPNHPMHSIEEADALLSDLPKDPLKALQDVTMWLTTITAATGFQLATRIAVVKMVDEAGQPFEAQLKRAYLTSRTLKEVGRQRLWQALQEFWERVAQAYVPCLDEMQQKPRLLRAHRHDLPLLIVRTLRALANQMKGLHLGPPAPHERLWQPLFEWYRVSEIFKCDARSFPAYPGDAVNTSARQELLRALMPSVAATLSMPPYQVELMDRIAARFGSSFVFKSLPEKGCNWFIDLAQPGQPEHVSGVTMQSPTLRFFGAGAAIAKIEEAIRYLLADPSVNAELFGDDFSPQEKLMVLKHLTRHWGEQLPYRSETRDRAKEDPLVLAHGFKATAHLLPHIEVPSMADVTRDMEVKFKEKPSLELAADPTEFATEKWLQHDASAGGVSARIPPGGRAWVTAGALCALKVGDQQWWVGAVRRLFGGPLHDEYAGIEVLSKEAASVWLRSVGEGTRRTDNWATSSGSFTYDYLNVILLSTSAGAPYRNELLVKRDAFVVGIIYEAMMGDKPHYLRFEELIERGADFDRVRFTWLAGKA